MKKLFALALVVLGLAACQTDHSDLDVQFDGNATVTLSIPADAVTRAGGSDSAKGGLENTREETLRFILAIYDEDDKEQIRMTQWAEENTLTANFPVRLVPGRKYTLVAWADMVDGVNAGDKHYNTEYLTNITLNVNSEWIAMDETRDAFTASKTIAEYSSIEDLNMQLTRPFAKLRVIATDVEAIKELDLAAKKATVTYNNNKPIPVSYNAFKQKVGTATESKVHTKFALVGANGEKLYDDNSDTQMVLYTDYIFANNEQGAVSFTIETFDQNDESIKETTFNTDIAVKRNMLTTLIGNVMTEGNNIEVTVDKEFGNAQNPGDAPYYNEIVEVGNAADLQEAISNSTEETIIVLGGDINLGDLFGASTFSTRATEATLPIVIDEGKVVNLDLNGCKITTPWEDEAAQKHYYAFNNSGSLTIQDSKGNGQIIARGIFNYGTMTLKSGTINACDGNGGYGVRNYEGATFVMDGGSIVTSYEDDDIPGEGYDASPLRVDEGATATINGGAINNVSNYTVAIDNYGTTTINDGTFTTIHTTIANSASMTINGGSFTCNGIEGITAHALWAAEGTTTINGGTFDGKDNYNGFNVDASKDAIVYITGGKFLPVHSGSLYGEGTIIVKGGEFFDDPSARVDSDYTVKVEDDMYVVSRKGDVAKIGEDGYTSLQKAVNAAENGATITFISDIDQVEGVLITDKNITIDLNNKTFTVSEGANTNSRNFKVNGSSVVTIKNGTMVAAGDYSSGAYGTLRTEGSANVTLENVKLYNYRGNGLNVKALKGTTVTITETEVYSEYGGGIEAAGGTIELTNVKVEQKGMYTAPYNSMTISVNGGGQVTVNSGTYSTECLTAEEAGNQGTSHGPWCAGVLNSGGTLIIKGGTFSNDNFGDNALATHARGLLLADTAANIQIEGGIFNAVKAIIDMTNNLGDATRNPSATLSGGVFSADPQVSGLYASHLIKVAEGYKVVENNGIYTVVVDPAAKIGETEYATLQEAFNVGGEITLLRNITVSEAATLAAGKTAVLDLNGFTIYGAEESTVKHIYAIKNYGSMTIKDTKGNGSIDSRGIYNYGTMTLNSGKISAIDGNGGYAVNNQSGSTFVMNGGWIAADYEDGDAPTSGNYDATALNIPSNATATLNGGKITNAGNFTYAIASAGTLNIPEESTLTVEGRHGTVSINGGETTINAGTYSIPTNTEYTDNVVYVYSSGKLVINGGTFIADKDIPNGGCCVCDAIGGATINGGVFGNSSGGDVWGTTGTVIKGGMFENLTETSHIADGYKLNENGEVVAK